MLKKSVVTGALVLHGLAILAADRPETDRAALLQLSQEYRERLDARRPQLYWDLLSSDDPAQMRLNEDRDIQLMFIDELGQPVYYTVSNLNAARTISTDDVWPGGGWGLELSGSGTATGELAVWDGGGVRTTHQEFQGRVTQMDSPSATHYHSTHVAGTMIAAGTVATAKGMSYQANLGAYDWTDDEIEMAAAAAGGLQVSSHSYGFVVGWYYNSGESDWYWYGATSISPTEDYGFGFYGSSVQEWDEIAYNAPYYLIVKSAGNNRDEAGPGPGGGHYFWNGSEWTWSTDTRDPDCPDGYDCLSQRGTGKNVLVIGAVSDIPTGYSGPGGVVMSSFSGWGPTDDGRIKPDIVANGIQLYSCLDGSDAQYASLSGTSMATPSVSGSVNLLVRQYESIHEGQAPLSSTMRAIVIQTADESGPYAGPDYRAGWGLMNTLKAARHIQAEDLEPGYIIEAGLDNGQTHEYGFRSDGTASFRSTIAWTDPAGTPPEPVLDPTDLMLVHDLDIRVMPRVGTSVYEPYVLDPSNPAAAATTGDNFRDNVEQINAGTLPAGYYSLVVSHKGSLTASQAYSLAASIPLTECGVTDSDGDGIPDGCDVCPGSDDLADADGDLVPDGCDQCPGFDDLADADGDTVPDGCDICPGADDLVDTDGDTVPDGCDICPGGDDLADADGDTVPDACDVCPGFDDYADADGDTTPDGCDLCPGFDDRLDADGDTMPDACDVCAGHDDFADADEDDVPDGCDNCPDDANPSQADHNGDEIGDACCCVDRVGDANGSGGDEPTISDASTMIDMLFLTGDPLVVNCLGEADVNRSGGVEPIEDDITISDVSTLIDYLFITGPQTAVLKNCP